MTDPVREMSVVYGDERIRFYKTTRRSGAQRVKIHVHPDCRVVVMAPERTSDEAVREAVRKRANWIWRQLRLFREQRLYALPRSYVSGETHYYLGRRHMLKVFVEPGGPQQVKLLRGRIEVTARSREPGVVKSLLFDWYRTHARDMFNRRLDVLLPEAPWIRQRPAIRLQTMQSQWGSCSAQGRFTLNPHLVKAPCECIDYVLLHELCHLAEHNHSRRFYRLLGQIMPGWERVKAHLDGMAETFLHDV